MTDEMTYDMNMILFTQLLMSFQASAMQQMGKIMNPFTQKIERDLSQAKMSIDMLAMIEEKTKGNLTDEEGQMLQRILFELRMNYVDEVEKEKQEPTEKENADTEGTPGGGDGSDATADGEGSGEVMSGTDDGEAPEEKKEVDERPAAREKTAAKKKQKAAKKKSSKAGSKPKESAK